MRKNSPPQEARRDRLVELEETLRRKKQRQTQLFWMKYNPDAEYKWDLEDAREDVAWMISEIKKLRQENSLFRELVQTLREQMEEELSG